jgi:ABC-type nitrate/sulfonate/bicarbonate transport system substrate-binding protein
MTSDYRPDLSYIVRRTIMFENVKMRTKHKIVWRKIVAILLLLTLAILFASCKKPEKSADPREKVTIGVGSGVISSPVMIAGEKGFFSEEGLDATIRFYPSGKKAMEGMFAGEVDIATVTDIPIVLNSFVRDDFSVFATFAYSYDNSKVIGRKDRAVGKPSELKGKKIGIVAGTSIHFLAHIYLTEQGVDPSAVILVDLAPADMAGALKDGRVDAVIVFEPYADEVMKALPGKAVKLPHSDLYRETFNLVAMRSYTKERPGVPIKILKAFDRAIAFSKQNRNESVAVIANRLKLEEKLMGSIWDVVVFELSLDHSLFTILEDEARWAIGNGFSNRTTIPNYLGYFYPDALKTVKPEVVTIIQ